MRHGGGGALGARDFFIGGDINIELILDADSQDFWELGQY